MVCFLKLHKVNYIVLITAVFGSHSPGRFVNAIAAILHLWIKKKEIWRVYVRLNSSTISSQLLYFISNRSSRSFVVHWPVTLFYLLRPTNFLGSVLVRLCIAVAQMSAHFERWQRTWWNSQTSKTMKQYNHQLMAHSTQEIQIKVIWWKSCLYGIIASINNRLLGKCVYNLYPIHFIFYKWLQAMKFVCTLFSTDFYSLTTYDYIHIIIMDSLALSYSGHKHFRININSLVVTTIFRIIMQSTGYVGERKS